MRIVFIEDDGLTRIAPYVRALGHEPVVLRSGVYDAWHANECDGQDIRVRQIARDATGLDLIDAALELEPDALVSLALLDPHCWRDALVGDFFRQSRGIPVLANSPATVLMANDKLRTKRLLARHGIAVTEAIAVARLAEAEGAAARLGYPLVLKRPEGYSGIGMRLVEDAAQLRAFFRRPSGPMLAEHFTTGIELSVDVLRWGGQTRPLAVIHKGATDPDLRRHPIYRLRLAPAPIAAAATEAALAIAARAMDLLGVVGLAECEMILHPEHGPLVLEVNPRIAGTAPLSAAASGIDLHRCLVDMALGRCALDRLHGEATCAVQIPVHSRLDPAALGRLAGHAAVRFVKPIDWAPQLGISASLTVAQPTPRGLIDALADIGRDVDLQPGLDQLHALLGI